MIDFILKVVVYGAVIFGVAALLQYVVYPLNETRCRDRWAPSGLSAKGTAGVGCLVDVNGSGQWVPEANVQISPRRN